jgi:hypothetical protein
MFILLIYSRIRRQNSVYHIDNKIYSVVLNVIGELQRRYYIVLCVEHFCYWKLYVTLMLIDNKK